MKRACVWVLLCGCVVGSGMAQTLDLNSTLPKVGSVAPALSFTKVLSAPAAERVSLASLRGRVVVLEFWATWCAPCVGEIPVVNALASSLDPKKVQFISVDDEDPKVVEAFLKKKPIAGWVGLDTTGGMFKRYGVDSRPSTVVIGPDGRVVSNSVRPEGLQREKLLALAAGKKTDVGGKVDAKVRAQLDADVKAAFAAEMGPAVESGDALFELKVSAAKGGDATNSRVMMMGPGKVEATNASVKELLSLGADVASSRMKVEGKLPDGRFNLHVNAPGVEPKELDRMIEAAVASAAGVRIEYETKSEDALVLTALPGGKRTLSPGAQGGIAFYQKETHSLRCIRASLDQVASALEKALGKPVVNETSLTGSVTMDIPLGVGDLGAVNEAVGKALGLTLTPGVRPIERVVVKAADGRGVATGS